MTHEVDFGKQVRDSGAYFLDGLQELQKRHKEIGDVDGMGLALRAEICTEDGFTQTANFLDKMVDMGLEGNLSIKARNVAWSRMLADITRTSLPLPHH